MKNLLSTKSYPVILIAMLILGSLLNSCRDPAYNIDVLFDAAVIKYKATIVVSDANGRNLPALNISVAGDDAAGVFDFSGTKKVHSPGGIITLGISPNAEPLVAKSLKFNVMIKASGYEDVNIPIEIANGQLNQMQNIILRRTTENTSATTFIQKAVELDQDGKTTAVTTISTTANAAVPTNLSLTIPLGTQFKNEEGVLQNGNNVNVQLVNFDQNDELATAYFPGGKYISDNVIVSGSTTPSSGFFIPAASASIRMFVGKEEIKSFSQPIHFTMEVVPGYIIPSTGLAMKAGDQMPVYSYSTATGQFTFEAMGTVYAKGEKLLVDISTSHLTFFTFGEMLPTTNCDDANVVFQAPWLSSGTRPVNIEISLESGRPIYNSILTVSSGIIDTWKGLPSLALHYKITDYNDELLAEGDFVKSCSFPVMNIILNQPSGNLENITLQLNIVCPGKGIIIVPNFDLYFKPSGTTDAAYRLLSTANNGLIKTTLLKVGNSYDFKATWGNQIKVVPNRLITERDMSTTVGEGLDLGKNPVANNALLIEACKSLN